MPQSLARKAQEWQDGQNILNALIAEALAQGANADEVIDLKTQAATQGLGVAIDFCKEFNANTCRAKCCEATGT